MKKTFYVFAALLAGFAMVACDKDDNGGGGGGGGEAVTYFGMPSNVTFEREGQEDSGLAYTMTGDKISKITYSYMASADKRASVDYTVAFEPNKCTVSFTSAAAGETRFIYELNADGYAARCDQYVGEDLVGISEYSYNADKMLTKIVADESEDSFTATYAGTELKTVFAANLGVEMDVTSSATLNGSKVDPLYFFLFGIFTSPDPSIDRMAAACGLLPQSKFVPKSLTAEDLESGEVLTMPFKSTVSGGKLTKVNIDKLSLVYNYK